jgi:hypothetical protein
MKAQNSVDTCAELHFLFRAPEHVSVDFLSILPSFELYGFLSPQRGKPQVKKECI